MSNAALGCQVVCPIDPANQRKYYIVDCRILKDLLLAKSQDSKRNSRKRKIIMGKRSPERRFTQVPKPATELGRQGAAQLVSERSKVLRRCAPDSILPSLDWLWEQVQRGLQLGFV